MPRKIGKSWCVDKWVTLPDGTRKRIRKASPINTKRGAEEYQRLLVEELLNPRKRQRKKRRFDQYFTEEFLEQYVKTNNSHAEYESKESIGRCHLTPFLGHRDLTEIDYSCVEAFKRHQKRQGVMAPTINNHLSVLRRALDEAIDLGYLQQLPRIKRLKEQKPAIDYLTYQEAEDLIQAAESEMLAVMIRIAARVGLRLGEIIALTRQNVDLVNREFAIMQAISRGKMGPTKDSDTRYIPMSEFTAAAIRTYLANRGEGAFQEFLFCNVDGTPMTPNQLKRPILRAHKAAGTDGKGRRWKVLRHTFASHSFMWGIPPEWVQQWLGHSDTKTTNRYAHLQRRYFEARPASRSQVGVRAVLPWEITNRWEAISLLDQPPPWMAEKEGDEGASVTELKPS